MGDLMKTMDRHRYQTKAAVMRPPARVVRDTRQRQPCPRGVRTRAHSPVVGSSAECMDHVMERWLRWKSDLYGFIRHLSYL